MVGEVCGEVVWGRLTTHWLPQVKSFTRNHSCDFISYAYAVLNSSGGFYTHTEADLSNTFDGFAELVGLQRQKFFSNERNHY